MNLLFLYEIYIKLKIGLIICLISHKISIIIFFIIPNFPSLFVQWK